MFIYDLSDDTNHDPGFTFYVTEDIITNLPEIIQDKFLVLCFGSCQGQYKCKYTFHCMKNLANTNNPDILNVIF